MHFLLYVVLLHSCLHINPVFSPCTFFLEEINCVIFLMQPAIDFTLSDQEPPPKIKLQNIEKSLFSCQRQVILRPSKSVYSRY